MRKIAEEGGGRRFETCPVLDNRPLGAGIFELETGWKGPVPRPGQFFMLRASRSRVLLGRPISVYASGEASLSFVIAERGEGTRELGALRPGDHCNLEGPLGSAWPAAPEGQVALVGGGIGLAPLLFLARGLRLNSYDLYAGYRSGSWGLAGLAPRALRVFTEDGSLGSRGRVLDGFAASGYSALFACGPEPMLRAVAGLASQAGVPAWLSLETRMACGVGACLGCTVRTKAGQRRACVEGPIFPAAEVIFDE
ncbi:MAG: dihydroorotate dehydrogenase electron transfer subunit [Spirochaetota bacterium]